MKTYIKPQASALRAELGSSILLSLSQSEADGSEVFTQQKGWSSEDWTNPQGEEE